VTGTTVPSDPVQAESQPLRVAPLVILVLCTHNRTRSVMMQALLDSMLSVELGRDAPTIRSGGFGPNGLQAIPDAVAAMSRRGLDISGHRSRHVTAALVEAADLVLTAERDHVVRVAGLVPSAFSRSFTLPEFLDRVGAVGPDVAGVADLVQTVSAGRTATSYLNVEVAEIADPTGSPAPVFEAAVVEIEQQCRAVADVVVRHARGH
jgi:protein-tyrosine phosphatase